jgi:protoheme IX farnesyltransferase
MKASAQTLSQPIVAEKSWVAIYADLFKARLTLLVLLTTMVGFYVGWSGAVNWWLMFNLLMGMGLVACGGAALNQWSEREHDARMRRTQDRPLPSGRMQPSTALSVGIGCAAAGLALLALGVNRITFALGAFTLVAYVLVYTPLKRVTWINTLIGAVPGAMPPLMGWTGATGSLGMEGLVLFAIQAFWQIPHFLAIAWLYREDYGRAGYKMLPVQDASGRRTSLHTVWHTAALALASVMPVYLGVAGSLYLITALLLSAAFLWCAVQFAREVTVRRARLLFYASLVYLPVLLTMLVLDGVRRW